MKKLSIPSKTKIANANSASPQLNMHNAQHAAHAKSAAPKPFKPKK